MAVEASEAELWEAIRARRNEAARTALVERYLYLAELTVTRTVPRVPIRLDREDLVAEAQLALVRAVDRFDPARGAAFKTFAISMLRGAVLEYLRREDWVPRSVRQRERAGEEIAVLTVVSLESIALGGDMADLVMLDQIADPSPGPEAVALGQAGPELLGAAVASLPEREQFAVREYYYGDRRHREIAADLGRSEARAHQLHQQGLAGLRAYFDRNPEEKQLMSGGTGQWRRAWSEAEDAALRADYGQRTARAIGERLGRSESSVSTRIWQLGLAKGNQRSESVKRIRQHGEETAMEPVMTNGTPAAATAPAPAPAAISGSLDMELTVMAEIVGLVASLDERARPRVLRWLSDRFAFPLEKEGGGARSTVQH